jgi:hypothetical protein
MAFAPIDLPIQQMLQTDFITDLSVIHNSNVLLLKDQFESLINNLEIDVNGFKIGTDTAIESIKTKNLILQDDGFIFQTGAPNQIKARLYRNGPGDSVLNVDYIEMQHATGQINVPNIVIGTQITTPDLTVNNNATVGGSIQRNGAVIESKEDVSVNFTLNGTEADGIITLTDQSKNNIYVTAAADTTVYNGTIVPTGAFNLIIDFDVTAPPAPNTTFTIFLVDIVEAAVSTNSILSLANGSNPFLVKAGTNNNTTNAILLHSDFATSGSKLGINYSGSDPLSNALIVYNSSATFNYIIDPNLNDRLMIKALAGFEVH